MGIKLRFALVVSTLAAVLRKATQHPARYVLLAAFACTPGQEGEEDALGSARFGVGECREELLVATKTYTPVSYQDAIVTPSPSMRFAIPPTIAVTAGNAGNSWLTFYYRLGGAPYAKCWYHGGASNEHPTTPPDIAAGLTYHFLSCTNGAISGQVVEADWIKLHVDAGDSNQGPTTVEMVLEEEEPCGGDFECEGVPVDDGNPCTLDACSPTTGVTHTPQLGASCSDNNACNGAETCDATGACQAGTPPVVDDGVACTIDVCDPVEGVTHYACSELDPTVTTTMKPALGFLIEGPNPVQTGVDPEDIDVVRAAAIRGRVFRDDGNPLPLATVSVLNHPEFGETITDANGNFIMLVNGGDALVANVSAQGYLTSQREIRTRWQAYDDATDIVMVPLDTTSTVIDLDTIVDPTVARGSVVTDDRGSRQATVVVTPGTEAEMVMPNGTTAPLSTITVRATEYTVGEDGPSRMPAELPPATGYTYALELSVDEAIAAGATSVRFTDPVSFFVDDTYDFPVGMIIPFGSYDRQKGRWAPEDNGLVIQVVSVTAGLANIDIDGDGNPNTALELDAVGITTDDRTTLATLYGAGKKLWQVRLNHFTPWDGNVPTGPEPSGEPPGGPLGSPFGDPEGGEGGDGGGGGNPEPFDEDDCQDTGSIIECRNQTLRESAPVAGTGLSLNYSSARAPGRTANRSIRMRVTGSSVPATVQRVDATLEVAGKSYHFTQQCPCSPDQFWTAQWDGRDAFGRVVRGAQNAKLTVANVYRRVFREPNWGAAKAFGIWGNGVLLVNAALVPSDADFPVKRSTTFELQHWDAENTGIGGYTLSEVHAYDPTGQVLYLGDGSRIKAPKFAPRLKGVDAGTAWDVIALPDGSKIVRWSEPTPSGGSHTVIRRHYADGSTAGILGTNVTNFNLCISNPPLNVPAVSACIGGGGADMAFAHDGSLYLTDTTRVLRVGPDGMLTHFAGAGGSAPTGDGGQATATRIGNALSLVVGPMGEVYIGVANRIRVVTPDGIISTVVGDGVAGITGDNGPAAQARVTNVVGMEFAADGSLYFMQSHPTSSAACALRRVAPSGVVTRIYGNGGSESLFADGVDRLRFALSPTGSIYLSQFGIVPGTSNQRQLFFRLTTARNLRLVSGTGTCSALTCPIETPVANMTNQSIGGFAVAPTGDLILAQAGQGLATYSSQLMGIQTGAFSLTNRAGTELYVFGPTGKHLETRDPVTNVVLRTMAYDAEGRIASITDQHGLVTTVERNGAGEPTAIVAPYGQRTELVQNVDGYLERIEDPLGEAYQMTYHPGGLLATWQNRNGHTTTLTYDAQGRVTTHQHPEGGTTTYVRSELASGFQVTKTSPMNRVTVHEATLPATGGEQKGVTSPSGLTSTELRTTADARVVTMADGTIVTTNRGPDPRWGMQAPVNTLRSVRLPSGLTRTVTEERSAAIATPGNPLSHTSLTEITRINGRPVTSVYTTSTRTSTTTTSGGRTLSTVFDALGNVTQSTFATDLPVSFTYDNDGRLLTTTQGTRTMSRTYDAFGFLASMTDPLSQTTTWSNNALGRTLSETRPDLAVTALGYDAEGNNTAVTPPGKPLHGFTFTGTEQMETYAPPTLLSGPTNTSYAYNLDKQIDFTTQPGPRAIDYQYDSVGRLSVVAYPGGTITRTYSPTTGHLASVSGPGNVTLTYARDGRLVTGRTWSGDVAGSVGQTFDTDFRPITESINAAANASWSYDPDSLMLSAGTLTMTREAATGRLSTSSVGVVTDARSYSNYGELATYEADVSGSDLYAYSFVRDGLGRIAQKTETVQGVTRVYEYDYDDAGRLVQVEEDAVVVESYTYDDNGNRLTSLNSAGSFNATYDAQDRLLTYGTFNYAWNDNGDLVGKTDTATSDLTTYDYDAMGYLRSVVLPDATVLDYEWDAEGHRVGKSRNGVLEKAWLYRADLQVVAELNGAGAVTKRFVYGEGVNVPELMIAGGVTYRLLKDHLGSVRLVVDTASGTVAQRIDYDAWGRVLADTNPGFTPFGFAGGLYDSETGLIRFGARDYQGEAGRWTRRDPIRFQGGINMFAYANDNPTNWRDVTGLDVCFHECRGGYQHEWVVFDKDPDRSYGFWPNIHDNTPLLSLFNLFGPGTFKHNDAPDGDCDPSPPVCRFSSPEEDAIIEEELIRSMQGVPYFLPLSNCTIVPRFVESRLDELQGTESWWDAFSDVFWDIL